MEPFEVQYPRISRGLLRYLVEVGFLIPKELGYDDNAEGLKKLKTDIENLEPSLLKNIQSKIYTDDNRLSITKKITGKFDENYDALEGMQIPKIPAELKGKEKWTKSR